MFLGSGLGLGLGLALGLENVENVYHGYVQSYTSPPPTYPPPTISWADYPEARLVRLPRGRHNRVGAGAFERSESFAEDSVGVEPVRRTPCQLGAVHAPRGYLAKMSVSNGVVDTEVPRTLNTNPDPDPRHTRTLGQGRCRVLP